MRYCLLLEVRTMEPAFTQNPKLKAYDSGQTGTMGGWVNRQKAITAVLKNKSTCWRQRAGTMIKTSGNKH